MIGHGVLISLLISGASFLLSAYALWVAQFNRGSLRMTRPTMIVLMRDVPSHDMPLWQPKIFLRTMLFRPYVASATAVDFGPEPGDVHCMF